MTVVQLRELAREKKVRLPYGVNKAQIVELLGRELEAPEAQMPAVMPAGAQPEPAAPQTDCRYLPSAAALRFFLDGHSLPECDFFWSHENSCAVLLFCTTQELYTKFGIVSQNERLESSLIVPSSFPALRFRLP